MRRTTRISIAGYEVSTGRRDGSNDGGTHGEAEGGKKLVRLKHVAKNKIKRMLWKECVADGVVLRGVCGIVNVNERGGNGDKGGLSVSSPLPRAFELPANRFSRPLASTPRSVGFEHATWSWSQA